MKLHKRLIGIALIVVVVVGTVAAGVSADVDTDRLFIAPLLGRFEVPAVLGQDSRGVAGLQYDGVSLGYLIFTQNAPTGLFAHIHCAPRGSNGPIGVTLSASVPFAMGVVTAPDANNRCGWLTLDDVANAMNAGNAYVNFHTPQFPSGELRGQIIEIS
jgi:hypothetical protein